MPQINEFILTKFMKLIPSWEAASGSATQEFFNIFCNPKIHYRVQNSPPLVPILRQINPVHTTLPYLSKLHLNIILPPMRLSSCWSLSFWLSHQDPIRFTLLPRACYVPCPSHPLYFIILIIFLEEYKLWVFSLRHFLQHSSISVFGSKYDVLFSAPCLQIQWICIINNLLLYRRKIPFEILRCAKLWRRIHFTEITWRTQQGF
jgi:hypothetical protein